ncbi:hypothetical protein Ahy_A05g024852 [Arachis hypogaea]|uniref:Uncharacterized protein n=1 Tax=Arachis hypogaea TaxID=3818 RepID=A0A445D788_ARAHY|nr:hypothetical protein Ahy_A05g024852 [Arachis hypogaea]
MASSIHKSPTLRVDNIQQWDWATHVLSFLRKGIENGRKGKKQSVDGCVFVLMLIYFHESKSSWLDAPEAPGHGGPLDTEEDARPDFLGSNRYNESRSESKDQEEEEIEKTGTKKRKQPQKVVKKESQKKKPVLTDSESISESEKHERVRVSAAERRREALQLLKENRAKIRNDKAQKTNVAPDRFDSTEMRNDLSEKLPTVNLGNEPLLQTQMSSTQSVNVPANTSSTTPDPELQIIEVREETRSQPLDIFPIVVSLPSSLKEELIKDAFTYVPSESITQEASVNDFLESQQQPCEEAPARQSEQEALVDVCPPKLEKQVSEESSPMKTELEPPLNVSPPEEQQQPCQEAPVAWQLEEEAHPDFCPLEPEKQAGKGSSPRKMEPEPPLNVAAHSSLWEHDAPSFELGISPPTSQPIPPTSQPTMT